MRADRVHPSRSDRDKADSGTEDELGLKHMMKDRPSVRREIQRLLEDMVAQKFELLSEDGRIGRLTVAQLKRAIADYGGTLVCPPQDMFDSLIEVYPRDGDPTTCAVEVDMWTLEEGHSDLTLSATLVETEGACEISIDGLHVL